MVSNKRAALLLTSLAFLSCEPDAVARTEIMLVVDSDLTVPAELDQLVMEVEGPNGREQGMQANLMEAPLPRSLGLVHTTGGLSPLRIRVTGMLAGSAVLSRTASLSFVKGETLVLPLHLARSCVAVECGEQTCTEQGCRDDQVDPRALAKWSGEEPTLTPGPRPSDDGGVEPGPDASLDDGGSGEADAGETDAALQRDAAMRDDASTPNRDAAADASTTDGGECQSQAEQCNSRDDDCDGVVDNGFDLQNDQRNCGRCGTICGSPRGMCCAGVCSRTCQ